MPDEPRVIKCALAHHPRTDLSRRLLEIAKSDERLLRSLAVCEARQPGYIGALIGHAHSISASLSPDRSFATAEVVNQAVDAALEWARPTRILVTPNTDPNEEAEAALVRLLTAEVDFHASAGAFDRRVFPRLGDEWLEHLSLEHMITPADWVR